MSKDYEYGKHIPRKYRNRLFEWKGGGYDGLADSPIAA